MADRDLMSRRALDRRARLQSGLDPALQKLLLMKERIVDRELHDDGELHDDHNSATTTTPTTTTSYRELHDDDHAVQAACHRCLVVQTGGDAGARVRDVLVAVAAVAIAFALGYWCGGRAAAEGCSV